MHVSRTCAMESTNFCWNKGAVSGVLCKNVFVADSLGRQYLLKILQSSLTVKNSENVVKSWCFEKLCDGKHQLYFEMKEGYKVSYVKILIFSLKKGMFLKDSAMESSIVFFEMNEGCKVSCVKILIIR